MAIYNYMEILVEQYMGEVLENDPTTAELLRQDTTLRARVMVQALNNIPPFYVTGKVGEVYGLSNATKVQNKADIMVEIAKAIEIIVKKGYNQ